MDRSEASLVRLSAWSVIVFIALFAIGWGFMGHNIPPYDAATPADELAAIYRADAATMRAGLSLGILACAFMVPWVVGLFRIMLAMEGGRLMLPMLQLAGGLLTVCVPMFSCVILLTAAFRPEQDPAITRMLFDLGWLTIDMVWGVTTLQYVAFGAVVLRDQRPEPLFPRWLAWLGIFLGCEFVLEFIMPYMRSGPFSWSGVFNYWLPFFGPFVWMILVVVYMLKATDRLVAEHATSPEPLTTT
jgi:hypothetical protein